MCPDVFPLVSDRLELDFEDATLLDLVKLHVGIPIPVVVLFSLVCSEPTVKPKQGGLFPPGALRNWEVSHPEGAWSCSTVLGVARFGAFPLQLTVDHPGIPSKYGYPRIWP